MPVLNYFLCVGGGLLALLFVADFYIPAQPQRTQTPHTYNIAITSPPNPTQSAVTFSGETRDFGAPPMTVVDFGAQPNAATPAPGQQALQARAEMTGTPTAVQSQKPARPKVAKRKINRRPADHDPAYIPDGWRQEPTGLAFAKPFFW